MDYGEKPEHDAVRRRRANRHSAWFVAWYKTRNGELPRPI